tara:strand:+ start:122 stop:547 length:426 start_codon:yes stop_codon:yes gene_type:complete
MKMNREDYEKEAEELRIKAYKLEATLATLGNLETCNSAGHELQVWVEPTRQEVGLTGTIRVTCDRCGAEGESGPVELSFDETNTGVFGDFAGMKLSDIELSPPTKEEEETEEDSPVEVESDKEEDGTYRVDVSSIIGKGSD